MAPANSLREAVNSGAAAAAALQALRDAGLWSLLQINTICSAEHVSFLHDTHSLLPRWHRGERQRGPGKGGKMRPRPFLTQSRSFKPIAWVGEGHLSWILGFSVNVQGLGVPVGRPEGREVATPVPGGWSPKGGQCSR